MTTSDIQGVRAEELNNFFKTTVTTFTLEDERNIPTLSTRISDTLSEISISEELIFSKIITILKWKQGTCTRCIASSFLKSCACSLAAKPLYLLTKQSLNSGLLPEL